MKYMYFVLLLFSSCTSIPKMNPYLVPHSEFVVNMKDPDKVLFTMTRITKLIHTQEGFIEEVTIIKWHTTDDRDGDNDVDLEDWSLLQNGLVDFN